LALWGGLVAGPTAYVVQNSIVNNNLSFARVSNSENNPEISEITKIINEVDTKISVTNSSFFPIWNKNNTTEISKIYQEAIKTLNDAVGNFDTVDAKIIGESQITVWKTSINGINAQSYLLGDNGGGILDAYDNPVLGNISDFSRYLNNENTAVFTVNDKVDLATELSAYFDNLKTNLELGLNSGVNFSQIWLKLFLQNIFGSYRYNGIFNAELAKISTTPGIVFDSAFCDANGVRTATWKDLGYFTKLANDYALTPALKTAVENIQPSLDKLISFMIGEYWFSATETSNNKAKVVKTYYGFSDLNKNKFQITNGDNSTELENKSKPNVKGIGFTTGDLNTKDIGIGYTNDKAKGIKIYDYMLQIRTSKNTTGEELNKLGKSKVTAITNNMIAVANTIADIASAETIWTPNVMYDSDSYGPKKAISTDLNIRDDKGVINLPNFFKFLNSEQWFFGRDMKSDQTLAINWSNPMDKKVYSNFSTVKSLTAIDPFNQSNLTEETINIGNILGRPSTLTPNQLGDAGNLYQYWVNGVEIDSKSYDYDSNNLNNTVGANNIKAKKEAYIGATQSVRSYLQYKTKTNDAFKSAFKPVDYDYKLTTGTGGAAYANSVDKKAIATNGQMTTYKQPLFYLDVNPYYGLQKWSMSTLSSHEAVAGHDFQFAYALTYPSAVDAPSFNWNAYGEGWGLFSEFLATRLNIYGESKPLTIKSTDKGSDTDRLQLPNFGVNNRGIDIKAASTPGYEFGNGVYTDKDGSQSQAYYDAIQYFGFLNERQLRAMRLTLDTQTQTGNGQALVGEGFSITDQRNYMKANSGLGQGDLDRESLRYLGFVGQATSYMVGLDTIEGLFVDANVKYEKRFNDSFINQTDLALTREHTSDLFDLILRNGDVALDSLTKYGNQYIDHSWDKGLSGGAIAGIVIGTLIGFSTIVGLSYYFIKKRNK